MTGSANDRFLMRSVRNSNIPNSINNQLDPYMLIKRRIENHEKRIKNENKSNKVIYDQATNCLNSLLKEILRRSVLQWHTRIRIKIK